MLPPPHTIEAIVLTSQDRDSILAAARRRIGTPYADLDCSHFVWQSYGDAGFAYDYAPTATFAPSRAGWQGPFAAVTGALQPADVLLFAGHMGLWDPDGCTVLGSNAECRRLRDQAPVLSSRSGGNRGPDFGVPKWWGAYRTYRWQGRAPAGIRALRIGQVLRPRMPIHPTKVAHWKHAKECASIGAGLTEAARLTVVEIGTTPADPWVRVQIPGSTPPRCLKISGDELQANFRLE